MTRHTERSAAMNDISSQCRSADFSGENPLEVWHGSISALRLADDRVSLHVIRSAKKTSGLKWRTESVYVVLDADTWRHLCSVPLVEEDA